MNRKLLFTFSMIVWATLSIAQSLQLENVVANYYDPLQDALAVKGNIRNNTGQSLNVLVKSQALEVPQGGEVYFCWAQCYNPNVIVAPVALTVEPNGILNQFHGYYKNNGAEGEARVRYTFYLESNPNDSIDFIATFDPATVGISDVSDRQASVSHTLSGGQFSIAYSGLGGNAYVELYNMLGNKIYGNKLKGSQGIVEVPVSSLRPGLYFYTIRERGNSIYTGKLVIRN
jgi:hypothetical protein